MSLKNINNDIFKNVPLGLKYFYDFFFEFTTKWRNFITISTKSQNNNFRMVGLKKSRRFSPPYLLMKNCKDLILINELYHLISKNQKLNFVFYLFINILMLNDIYFLVISYIYIYQ